MTVDEQERIDELETVTRALTARVALLEQQLPGALRQSRPPAAPAPRSERLTLPSIEPPAPPPAPPAPPPAEPPRSAAPARGLEDLFGGRVLAWIGGVAVLVGIALFFALAVSNGWVGETARVLLAGAGASVLLTLGVWLRERKAQAEAALAAAGTGVTGLFMTVTVAAAVYGVIPALPAFWLAAAVGAVAMVLAVRWRSRVIAALGIVGSLLAPVMVGAPSTGTTIALLFTVTAAAATVLVWQRWDWLAVATFLVATPQWVIWIFETDSTAGILLALCGFGGAGVLAAVGFELRLPHARLRASSSVLFALNAIVLGTAGYLALREAGGEAIGQGWLAALAATYVALGVTGSRSSRISHDLQLLVLTIGVLLADIAFAAIVSGPVLAIGWAGSTAIFAALVRHRRDVPADALLAQVGLGGHLALAIGHALVNDAAPASVDGTADATALLVAAAIAASCFTSARIAAVRPDLRVALDLVGLAFVAYLTALAVEGPGLVMAWSVEAVVLANVARIRRDAAALAGTVAFLALAAVHVLALEAPLEGIFVSGFPGGLEVVAIGGFALAAFVSARLAPSEWVTARQTLDVAAAAGAAYCAGVALDGPAVAAVWGVTGLVLALVAMQVRSRDVVLAATGFGALALAHALVYEAPPAAFLYGAGSVLATTVALAASAAGPLVVARLGWLDRQSRVVAAAAVALTLLYLASVVIVTVLESGGAHAVMDLGVRQQGQALVSGLWGLVGVGALITGLRRDVRELRVGALVLLLATSAKVFAFDLAALTSIYRVGSFVALGLLLLGGSFAYQRLRPRILEPGPQARSST